MALRRESLIAGYELIYRRSRGPPGGATAREARAANAGVRGGSRAPPTRSDLDEKSVAMSAAGADRGEPEPAAVPPQLVDHGREDPRARGADRMSERDGAAVDVHLVGVGAEHAGRVDDDRREGLV